MAHDARLSKRLSYVLRHEPESIGMELDAAGWVDLAVLVAKLRKSGVNLDESDVHEVVAKNDKKRFEVVDGKIRAAQGHSIDVNLGLASVPPPDVLWHGTVERFIDSILTQGLMPSGRQHVHLSESFDTANIVGSRRGKPALLKVASQKMANEGHEFFVSSNGVWLTSHVPTNYIEQVDRRPN